MTATSNLSLNSTSFSAATDDLQRRQNEWDRQMVHLDHQQTEVADLQWKLIREQMGSIARELTYVRGDMAVLKKECLSTTDVHVELQGQHSTLFHRVDNLEQFIGESSDKGTKAIEEAQARLKDTHLTLANQRKAHEDHVAAMEQRLAFIERQMGDSADMNILRQEMDRDKKHRDKILDAHSELKDHHASLRARIEFLEKTIGESADKHAKMLEDAHNKIKDHTAKMQNIADSHGGHKVTMEERLEAIEALFRGKLKEHADQFQNNIDSHKAALDARHSVNSEQLNDLHGMVSKMDAARSSHKQKIDERLDAYSVKLKEHQNQMQEVYASHMGAKATLEDRLESVEASIRGIIDKHAGALEGLNSKLKDTHGVMKGEKAAREQHHASFEQRLMFLEKKMGDSADNHLQQLEELDKKHKALASKIDDVHGTVKGEKEARSKHHASINERIDYLEKCFGDSADKHEATAKLLENCQGKLKDFHGHISKHQAETKQSHVSMEERMEFLEKQIGDSADNHKKTFEELDSLRTKHKKMTQDHDALHGHVKGEKETRDQYHASVQERLEFLEQFVGDSADKHQKAMKDLDAAHASIKDFHGHMNVFKAAHDSHKATIEERLEFVEKQMGDTADKHAEALDALKGNHAKMNKTIDQLHGHIKGEKATREKHHATVEERIAFLESTVGDSADKHDKLSKLLDAAHTSLKDIHGKHNGEKAARDQHHASLQERLEFIETCIGDSADKHSAHINDLTDLKERLKLERNARDTHAASVKDQLDRHEKARQAHHDNVKEILASERNAREEAHQSLQESVRKEKTAREKHHATYQEFLDREKTAHEQHRNSIDDLLSRERAERLKHHETVEGRVDALERTIKSFDEIARKEQDERKADLRRVWDAIDSHTHDLTTCVAKDDITETPAPPPIHVSPAPTVLRSVTSPPTVVRSVTPPARVTPVCANKVMSMVQRYESGSRPLGYTTPPLTNPIASVPVTIIPASPVPAARAVPVYETRAMVPELVHQRSPESCQHHHSTETIACGHTRYGGQVHASAQFPIY